VITHAGGGSVTVRAGRVAAIKTENHGTIAVDAALLATGSNVPKMASEFGITIPDATTTALLINTRPVQSPLRVVLNTPRVSLRPTPNGALAIDADWAESRIERQEDGTHEVGAETIKELLAEASRVLAARPQLAAATYGIGPKPIPGDGEPVLGQLGDISGLYVAFTHSGATLALIIGELLAYEIMTGRSHPLLAPFAASRFGAG
jgi:glycine/D-amino acid oxidase-like deaminating enzyme